MAPGVRSPTKASSKKVPATTTPASSKKSGAASASSETKAAAAAAKKAAAPIEKEKKVPFWRRGRKKAETPDKSKITPTRRLPGGSPDERVSRSEPRPSRRTSDVRLSRERRESRGVSEARPVRRGSTDTSRDRGSSEGRPQRRSSEAVVEAIEAADKSAKRRDMVSSTREKMEKARQKRLERQGNIETLEKKRQKRLAIEKAAALQRVLTEESHHTEAGPPIPLGPIIPREEEEVDKSLKKFNVNERLFGKWRGDFVINYKTPPCKVECIIGKYDKEESPKNYEGWMWMTSNGEFGGPEGMVINWRGIKALPSLSDDPTQKDWAVDLTFPASISIEPVPVVMNFADNKFEMAFPASDMSLRPTTYAEQPTISMTKITEEEPPKPIKEIKLGTSLKHVAMTVVKEVKKLCLDVFKVNKSEKGQKVVFRFWNIRLVATVEDDPFWTVMRLRIGIAKIFADVPPLQPGGSMSSPVYLAQACEDEKDGRLQDRLDESLEELSTKFGDICFTHSNLGDHNPVKSMDEEVEWYVGYSLAGSDPMSAYILTNPEPEALSKRHRALQLSSIRPIRTFDLIGANNPYVPAAEQGEEEEFDMEGYAEKGQRGKLIMAAERNKKALEDGTYGKSGSGYDAGTTQTLGHGKVASKAIGSTVVEVRLLKLKAGKGKTLCDTEVSQAEAEAAEIMNRRNDRLEATTTTKLIEIRKARALMMKTLTFVTSTPFPSQVKKAMGKSNQEGGAPPPDVDEMRAKRMELLTRKFNKGSSEENDGGSDDQAVTSIDPSLLVDRDKMINGRKRKILDFVGKRKDVNVDESGNFEAKMDQPINAKSSTDSTKKQPEMTEEEKEMLAILKGISSTDPNKFETDDVPSDAQYEKIIKEKVKIRDPKKTSEIAKMRLEVLVPTPTRSRLTEDTVLPGARAATASPPRTPPKRASPKSKSPSISPLSSATASPTTTPKKKTTRTALVKKSGTSPRISATKKTVSSKAPTKKARLTEDTALPSKAPTTKARLTEDTALPSKAPTTKARLTEDTALPSKAPTTKARLTEDTALPSKAPTTKARLTEDTALPNLSDESKAEMEEKAKAEFSKQANGEMGGKAKAELAKQVESETGKKVKAEAEKRAKAEAEKKAKEELKKKVGGENADKAQAEFEKQADSEAGRKAKAEVAKQADSEAGRAAKKKLEEKAKGDAGKQLADKAKGGISAPSVPKVGGFGGW